jgi:hypothetical protein
MYLTYDNLTKIVASQAHYRGRPNDYPTHGRAYRRHGHKFFSPDVIDNEIVFRINYGKLWNKIDVTPEQANLLKKLGKDIQSGNKIVYDANSQTYTESKEVEYWYYDIKPQEIGIVRPDNTFEFTEGGNLGQGTRYYLEKYCFKYGSVYTNCSLGGVILDGMIPLFKGLRIDLETVKPAEGQDIKLFKKVVNRSAAKELFADYKEMLSVSKAMFSQMDDKVFIATMQEVLTDQNIVWQYNPDKPSLQFTSGADVVKKADELRIEGNYFDSAVLYGYGYDLGGVTWRLRHSHSWVRKEPFINMERHLRKVVYQHKKPFVLKEMEYGKELSSSEWGYVITKDGKSVNQYSY